MTFQKQKRICWFLVFGSIVSWSTLARSTEGDVFAVDVKYVTATYSGHPAKCGIPIDINIANTGCNEDEGTDLYAPESGFIEELPFSEPEGWGHNIYWTSDNGEKLFLAHLQSITRTGYVSAGDEIGKLGKSGGPWGASHCAHLHIERCDEELELSGQPIVAADVYTSLGPVPVIGVEGKVYCTDFDNGSYAARLSFGRNGEMTYDGPCGDHNNCALTGTFFESGMQFKSGMQFTFKLDSVDRFRGIGLSRASRNEDVPGRIFGLVFQDDFENINFAGSTSCVREERLERNLPSDAMPSMFAR